MMCFQTAFAWKTDTLFYQPTHFGDMSSSKSSNGKENIAMNAKMGKQNLDWYRLTTKARGMQVN